MKGFNHGDIIEAVQDYTSLGTYHMKKGERFVVNEGHSAGPWNCMPDSPIFYLFKLVKPKVERKIPWL